MLQITSTPGVALTEIANSLERLKAECNTSSDTQANLKLCFDTAKLISNFSAAFPSQAYSLISLKITGQLKAISLSVQSALFIDLICKRCQWSETSAQSLMSAVLLASVFGFNAIPSAYLTLLRQLHLDLCYETSATASKLLPKQNHPAWFRSLQRLKPFQLLALLCCRWTLQLQIDKSKTSLMQLIAKDAPLLPPKAYFVIDKLFPFPGQLAPGSLLKLADSRLAVVLGTSEKQVLVIEWQKSVSQFSDDVEWIAPDQIKSCHCAFPIHSAAAFDELWVHLSSREDMAETLIPANEKTHYLVSKPPAKLMVIQNLLHHSEPNIDLIAHHIASEGFLANQLSLEATAQSRMKLPMADVKHALLYQGFERTSHILIQQALLNRLNQEYFPLQGHLLQLTILFGSVVEHLSNSANRVAGFSMKTTGYFLMAGLFLQSKLKTRTQLPPLSSPGFNINQLFALQFNHDLQQQGTKLAQHWQQDKTSIKALIEHNTMNKNSKGLSAHMSLLLGLALILTRKWFFSDSKLCLESNDYLQSGLRTLNINSSQVNDLFQNVAADTHYYCPLS